MESPLVNGNIKNHVTYFFVYKILYQLQENTSSLWPIDNLRGWKLNRKDYIAYSPKFKLGGVKHPLALFKDLSLNAYCSITIHHTLIKWNYNEQLHKIYIFNAHHVLKNNLKPTIIKLYLRLKPTSYID